MLTTDRRVVHLIPHTHWDREWYLPLGAFRARLIGALDGLLAQLAADPRLPGFLLDGQTILLEDYLEVRPERLDEVARLVQAGRLDIGPWYVLADEQIPGAESLVRNLLLGGAATRRFGGAASVLYSPDAFGHPGCLPQLGAEFGMASGVLWRGVSPAAMDNRDLAWWSGPDSRRLLVYHLPPDGYEIGSGLLVPEERLAAAWQRVAGQVLPRAATRHVAVLVGADHHAPPRDLGELSGRLAKIEAGEEFRFSRLADFLQAAGAEARELAVLRGEQRRSDGYTWALQGVHGTRAPLKRRNSLIELQLTRLVEPLVSLTTREPGAGILRQAWREVIQCHFHDAIAGCCSDQVARAMTVRFDTAQAALDVVVADACDQLAGHDPDLARERGSHGSRLLLWNPVARERGGVVVCDLTFFRRDILVGPPGARRARRGPGMKPFVLRSVGGPTELVPQIIVQERGLERLDARRHCPDLDDVDRVRIAFPLDRALQGFGGGLFEIHPRRARPGAALAGAAGRSVWNSQVKLELGGDGRAVVRVPGTTTAFSGVLVLESERDLGDSYSFCPAPGDRVRRGRLSGRPRVTASGPYLATLEWRLVLRAGAGIEGRAGIVTAHCQAEAIGDSQALRLRLALDNQAQDHRLRLRLPTGLARTPILAGAQFGVVGRPPPSRVSGPQRLESPVPTAPAHRFVAAASTGYGLAVFAPGFFEYEWNSRGELMITLLRAVGQLSKADLRTRPGHAGWSTATPEAQCMGQGQVELGLALVRAEDIAEPARLEQLWEDIFVPPVARWIRDYHQAGAPLIEAIGCTLEGDGLQLSALKPAESTAGTVARCYNLRPAVSRGCLRFRRRVGRATEVRADETPVADLPLEDEGRCIPLVVGPRGLKSVLVEWT
jgi:alpha-mannosidase